MYYYGGLVALIIAAIFYYLVIGSIKSSSVAEHPIGVNLTKENGTCIVRWLGGWDFDSFYGNVRVNGINKGHPKPMTVIYNGTCKDLLVTMYDRAVQTDVVLYRYNHTEAS